MAINSGIFNSVNGDRLYDASDFASYFAMFIGNGIFPNPANGFQVTATSGMNITLKAGRAWIHGYYVTNDDNYNMTVDVADGVLNRIDRVVLQLDYLNRKITPLIKKGTFASSPIAPSLKRDADAYELAIADIYVGKGVLSITQANITDLRLKSELCGIVHGVVDQIDTSEVFHQFQDWYERMKQKGEADLISWTNEQKQAFMTWFDSLRDILSENAETNILNKIDVLDRKTGDLNKLKTVERTSVVDVINELADEFSVYPSDYDDNDFARVVEWKRSDGTLYRKSVFSNSDENGNYLKQVITYYSIGGSAVKTQTWEYAFDEKGRKTKEQKVNEVIV